MRRVSSPRIHAAAMRIVSATAVPDAPIGASEDCGLIDESRGPNLCAAERATAYACESSAGAWLSSIRPPPSSRPTGPPSSTPRATACRTGSPISHLDEARTAWDPGQEHACLLVVISLIVASAARAVRPSPLTSPSSRSSVRNRPRSRCRRRRRLRRSTTSPRSRSPASSRPARLARPPSSSSSGRRTSRAGLSQAR